MKSEKFWLSLLFSRNEKWKENEWKWNFLRISEIIRKIRILTTFLFSKNKNKPKIWYWLIVPCNHSQDLFKIIMINHLECWWSWSPWPPAPYCVDLLSTTLRIYSRWSIIILSLDDHHHQHLFVLTYCQPLSGSIHGQRASQHSAHTQSVCLSIHCGQSSIFIVIIIIFFHYPAGQPWLRNFVFSGMTSRTIQSMQLEGLD